MCVQFSQFNNCQSTGELLRRMEETGGKLQKVQVQHELKASVLKLAGLKAQIC